MKHPILVPVDFSGCARAALIYAGRMTSDTRTPLLVLHVLHDNGDTPGVYRRHDANPLLPLADVASEMLEDWVAGVRRETPELDETLRRAQQQVVGGLPGSRIVEVADHAHAALIVMGTHGRNGLSQLLRGSVTDYVLAHATVPVTTLREGVDTARGAGRLKLTTLIEGGVTGEP